MKKKLLKPALKNKNDEKILMSSSAKLYEHQINVVKKLDILPKSMGKAAFSGLPTLVLKLKSNIKIVDAASDIYDQRSKRMKCHQEVSKVTDKTKKRSEGVREGEATTLNPHSDMTCDLYE